MAAAWFHHETIPEPGGVARLDADAVRHAAGARRLRDGDAVTLFDGRGAVARAVLVDRGRSVCVESTTHVAPPTPAIAIAAALPKGDRAATMVDLATQLGMAEFIPLRCGRSVVTATDNGIARLRRVAIEASKQCRRTWLPRFAPERTPEEVIDDASRAGARVALADQAGGPPGEAIGTGAARVVVLIGPEGGFTEHELAACDAAGVRRLALGANVLRIEAAVSATCAIVAAWFRSGCLHTKP